MYASLTPWLFPLRPLLARNGNQYYDVSWKVSTRAASYSHRPPCFHKRYLLIHQSEPQTYAGCSAMTILSPVHYSLQWNMIQTLIPQLNYIYCWTRLLAHCFKTTLCQSEIVLSQCHHHDSRQQKNRSIWSCLLQLEYYLGFTPQRPYKTPSSHTAGTCFIWWQDVPGQNPTSSSDTPSNIKRYGMLAQGYRLGESWGIYITVKSPTGCPGVQYLWTILAGRRVPGTVVRRPT